MTKHYFITFLIVTFTIFFPANIRRWLGRKFPLNKAGMNEPPTGHRPPPPMAQGKAKFGHSGFHKIKLD
jgi:hypothetical protein